LGKRSARVAPALMIRTEPAFHVGLSAEWGPEKVDAPWRAKVVLHTARSLEKQGRGPAENNPLLLDSLRSSALRASVLQSQRLRCKRLCHQDFALRVTRLVLR